MKIETNEKLLVNVSVVGSVCQPNFQSLPAEPYRLDANGSPFLLPSWGSIVHNVSIGDSAFGWEADCIHPGVSIKYPNEAGNRGLNILSCVGNDATIMSGEAKYAKGIVTGKSGRFSEQVIVHFPKKSSIFIFHKIQNVGQIKRKIGMKGLPENVKMKYF